MDLEQNVFTHGAFQGRSKKTPRKQWPIEEATTTQITDNTSYNNDWLFQT
jgi:hypothetical protein